MDNCLNDKLSNYTLDVSGKMYYIANSEWFKGSGGFVNNSPILANEQVNGKKLSSASIEIIVCIATLATIMKYSI